MVASVFTLSMPILKVRKACYDNFGKIFRPYFFFPTLFLKKKKKKNLKISSATLWSFYTKTLQDTCLTSEWSIFHQRTLIPRKRLLKRLRKIKQTPANDDIVVESDKKAHLQNKIVRWHYTSHAPSFETRMKCIKPHLTY